MYMKNYTHVFEAKKDEQKMEVVVKDISWILFWKSPHKASESWERYGSRKFPRGSLLGTSCFLKKKESLSVISTKGNYRAWS
jgi:hypothetical protein